LLIDDVSTSLTIFMLFDRNAHRNVFIQLEHLISESLVLLKTLPRTHMRLLCFRDSLVITTYNDIISSPYPIWR